MNIYFLVEGRRTETRMYRAWLSYLVPELREIRFNDSVNEQNYKIICAGGQPFYPVIKEAVQEVNADGQYNYLIICLDAEENTVEEQKDGICHYIKDKSLKLKNNTELVIIVQNRCIETWLLGNRRIYSRNPQSPELIKYTRYYNVAEFDPERMGKYEEDTHARFHEAYLKAMFAERNTSYSKKIPGHAKDKAYLEQLITRVQDEPEHLASFKEFLVLCKAANPDLELY